MVFAMSFLLFVLVTAILYFFGVRFWVQPKTVVDRVVGDAWDTQPESKHPSLAFHDLLAKVGNFVPKSTSDLSLTQKRLYNAGFRSPTALKVFYGIKTFTTVLVPLSAWLLTLRFGVSGDAQLGLVVLGLGAGFLGPNEFLQLLVKRRRKKMSRALPNALDLLVVCVESGLGLDQGLVQVGREMQQGFPELSNELAVTNLEMRHGKRRTEALRNLAERTGIDDMKKLVSVLIQADRFGTSIGQALRTHADFMRLTARQRAEEKAAKIGIKLVFPIFFCILPSLFVVTVGPVIVRILFELIPMMEGG